MKKGRDKSSKSMYKTLLGNKKQYSDSKGIQSKAKASEKFNYGLYNVLEKKILGIEFKERDKTIYETSQKLIDSSIHKIKILSIQLERNNPMEWNTFLDVALEN